MMGARKNHSVTDAKNVFKRAAEKMDKHYREALEEAAVIVETEAKRVIGTYEYGWPRLQPATVARKGADTPLLETGELRDSIEHYTPPSGPLETFVGSNNPKAKWHELGTVHIPARSFLMAAAMHKEREIHQKLGIKIHAKIAEEMTGQPKGARDL
jgi:phage gpG-like protein